MEWRFRRLGSKGEKAREPVRVGKLPNGPAARLHQNVDGSFVLVHGSQPAVLNTFHSNKGRFAVLYLESLGLCRIHASSYCLTKIMGPLFTLLRSAARETNAGCVSTSMR